MIKNLMKKKFNSKKDDGFTLIEMLLVLLVISVLIILIIPNIAAQSANVQDTGCDAQVKMVQSQIQAYTLNEGGAPASVSALVPDYLTNDQVTCANGTGIVIVNGQAAKSE
ncbi:competence type IV pilus major pilin ComGC [Salinicoccus halodurans]|uniref:ComG operon protein 3 n=2 Tax=Salinicoccus halodurans TaxID=407035 RepID=A0AA94HCT1_9STAP|nr:competence type IV pilus major pilin ComGC [Salinicoccus halodurans]SFK59227.1 competence protein ComGC [Salinicoccus halodurans]